MHSYARGTSDLHDKHRSRKTIAVALSLVVAHARSEACGSHLRSTDGIKSAKSLTNQSRMACIMIQNFRARRVGVIQEAIDLNSSSLLSKTG